MKRTGKQLKKLRQAYNLDVTGWGLLIGVSDRTVRRWESAERPNIDPRSRELVNVLFELRPQDLSGKMFTQPPLQVLWMLLGQKYK